MRQKELNDYLRDNFNAIDLSHQDLTNLEFPCQYSYIGANFEGAMMLDVNMSYIDAYYANFRCAKLINVDLTGANLRRSDLSHANLINVNLTNTTLSEAKIKGLTGISVYKHFDVKKYLDRLDIVALTML